MNDKRYRYILYVITIVIVATIGIQVYWNYKNYVSSKQQLIRDVQISLDKAVDDYYAELAKKSTVGFSFEGKTKFNSILEEGSKFSNILGEIDEQNKTFSNLDSLDVSTLEGVSVFRGLKVDSMTFSKQKESKKAFFDSLNETKIKDVETPKTNIDIDLKNIEFLSTQMVISIKNDTLDVAKVHELLKEDFKRKGLSMAHNLMMLGADNDTSKLKLSKDFDKHFPLSITSKSTLIPKNKLLKLSFLNETSVILKRIFGSILISTFLILAVISCLFYLLKIINKQKQLAEVKNDLISNITHEFKTPIATIGAALEGINNFNIIDDKEKTKRYIDMSSGQLSKLNLMVEKLLETATLDSKSLNLNKEPIDIISLLKTLIARFQSQHTEKNFTTDFKVENLVANVDVFHFENALNNILDNAVKYGGNDIKVGVIPHKNEFKIHISDNGTSLNKANKERIFEKFYRVPKGNKHDVKGFGIGLFYTKSIIEKHDGSIKLDLLNKRTTFKIEIPNG